MRLPIREALALTTFYGKHRTFTIRDLASVIAKIKLSQIPMRVLFGAIRVEKETP
jgi:hypothetical protein